MKQAVPVIPPTIARNSPPLLPENLYAMIPGNTYISAGADVAPDTPKTVVICVMKKKKTVWCKGV